MTYREMKFSIRMRRIIEETDTLSGKLFDWFVQIIILISLISFSLETLPNLSEETSKLLRVVEVGTISIFTVELILRVIFSSKGIRYLFTFFGFIDLLAVLPFYLSLGVDLRSLRIFRFVRLVRLLKLARYSKAMRRYHIAFLNAREELILFGAVALAMMYLSAVGIYYFDAQAQPDAFSSIPECLWWSVATLTTVGYGDVYPITTGGKVFTFFILAIGLAAVAIPSGIMASALTKARDDTEFSHSEEVIRK